MPGNRCCCLRETLATSSGFALPHSPPGRIGADTTPALPHIPSLPPAIAAARTASPDIFQAALQPRVSAFAACDVISRAYAAQRPFRTGTRRVYAVLAVLATRGCHYQPPDPTCHIYSAWFSPRIAPPFGPAGHRRRATIAGNIAIRHPLHMTWRGDWLLWMAVYALPRLHGHGTWGWWKAGIFLWREVAVISCALPFWRRRSVANI